MEWAFLTQRRKGTKAQRVFSLLASLRLGDFALKVLLIREIHEIRNPQLNSFGCGRFAYGEIFFS
jgi:hypothetical protein